MLKVCSGVLKGRRYSLSMQIRTQRRSRASSIQCAEINRSEVTELFAGDIGAIAKLSNTRTGDTLSTKETQIIILPEQTYSIPYTYMRYSVKNKGDDDKVSQALAEDDGRGCDTEGSK